MHAVCLWAPLSQTRRRGVPRAIREGKRWKPDEYTASVEGSLAMAHRWHATEDKVRLGKMEWAAGGWVALAGGKRWQGVHGCAGGWMGWTGGGWACGWWMAARVGWGVRM